MKIVLVSENVSPGSFLDSPGDSFFTSAQSPRYNICIDLEWRSFRYLLGIHLIDVLGMRTTYYVKDFPISDVCTP